MATVNGTGTAGRGITYPATPSEKWQIAVYRVSAPTLVHQYMMTKSRTSGNGAPAHNGNECTCRVAYLFANPGSAGHHGD